MNMNKKEFISVRKNIARSTMYLFYFLGLITGIAAGWFFWGLR